ncbi:MAG: DUF4397 domain-containing protein [Terriglobales bacterium]
MRRSFKSLPLALSFMLALAAVGFFLTSCSNNSSQGRFVNAVVNAGNVDIFFGGTRYFTDLGFQGFEPASSYSGVPAGSSTIIGYPTGTSTTETFSVSNVNLNAGSQYTLVAAGVAVNGPNSNVVVLNPVDNNNVPANGTVNFRVINASPDGPLSPVIYITPNPIIGNGCNSAGSIVINPLAYQAASGYEPIQYNSQGGYTVFVCNTEGGNPIFSGTNLGTIGGPNVGSIRTIIFTDNSGGTGMSSIPVVLKDDN